MIKNSQPDGGYVLCLGARLIPFQIEYRDRKSLAISVHPDLRLEVVAPLGRTSAQVLPRIEKRSAWILRQWQYFEQYQPTQPGRNHVSGETHLYLGRQYRLKVCQGATESVKLIGPFLQVRTADRSNTGRIRLLLEQWRRDHARLVFERRLRICLQQCPSLKRDHPPRLLIKKMARRWGSCTKAGNVVLNVDLVNAPTHCVDYVIIHELCHLQIHNHSPAFYRLLSRCLPDWETRKRRLEGVEV
jgi:predicted metal-dependent hydrolase